MNKTTGQWLVCCTLKGHTAKITSIGIISEDEIVGAFEDMTLMVWSKLSSNWIGDKVKCTVLKEHTREVNVVRVNHHLGSDTQGQMASGSGKSGSGGELIVWEKKKTGEWTKEDKLKGHGQG